MPTPQSGIVPEPSPNALFAILRVRDPTHNGPSVANILAGVPTLLGSLGASDRTAALVGTVGFGSGFWDIISPARRPAGLRPFTALDTRGKTAPSTGGDVLLHMLSTRHDLNFELLLQLAKRLGDRVKVLDEVHGFRYLDSRDLTGFIDGTENPSGDAQRAAVALIGDEDPDFAGGSYVFVQRYVHKLNTWAALSEPEQEAAIGRSKADSKELPETIKPPSAHISRVVIEENGEELEIVRHSFPYGTLNEHGLFFIAYTRNLDIPEHMLRRMLGATGDGHHDRLMDFTQAVSGAHFFVPSLELLTQL